MFEELLKSLQSNGVVRGDILYIPSDITQLIFYAKKNLGITSNEKRNKLLNELLDTFKTAVGEEGNLLFPIFTWDFNHGLPFDLRKTLGKVGSLPNWIFQNRTDFIRTQHPMYSFLVWGKDAEMLANMNNVDCWGQYSPFGYMHRCDAKIILFNVSAARSLTFTHYVEESIQVPYRYFKNFRGSYIDANGIEYKRNYIMYVRDLNISMKEFEPDSFYEGKGVMNVFEWNNQILKIMRCQDAYNVVADDLLNNFGNNIYKFEDYSIDWLSGIHTHPDELDN